MRVSQPADNRFLAPKRPNLSFGVKKRSFALSDDRSDNEAWATLAVKKLNLSTLRASET